MNNRLLYGRSTLKAMLQASPWSVFVRRMTSDSVGTRLRVVLRSPIRTRADLHQIQVLVLDVVHVLRVEEFRRADQSKHPKIAVVGDIAAHRATGTCSRDRSRRFRSPGCCRALAAGCSTSGLNGTLRLVATNGTCSRRNSLPVFPNWFDSHTYGVRPEKSPKPPRICSVLFGPSAQLKPARGDHSTPPGTSSVA